MRDRTDQSGDGIVSIELGVSRRKLMKQLGAAGLITGVAGCANLRNDPTPSQSTPSGSGNSSSMQAGDESALPEANAVRLTPPPTADEMDLTNPTHETREMVFVCQGLDPFFTTVIAGVNDGLNNVGWKGRFIGPSNQDNATQVEMLNTTVNRLRGGKDVLASTIMDPNSYQRPVMQAVNKDIPVLHFNTTVDEWTKEYMIENFGYVQPYVGQKMVPAGVAVAREAYNRAQEKFGDENIVFLPTNGVPGHPALEARVQGMKMFFETKGNAEVLDTLDVGTDLAQATSRISDAYSANPDINIIVGSAWWGSAGAAKFRQNEEITDEIVSGGFDLTEPTLEGIKNGYHDFGSTQDGYSQGYVPVQLAWMFMERGIPMKSFDTGVSFADQSNVDWAEKAWGNWDALTKWQDNNYNL